MAGQLKRKSRPRWPLILIAAGVLLIHGLLGSAVHRLQQDWQQVDPAPPRLAAVFVRELVEQRRPSPPRPMPRAVQAPPQVTTGAAATPAAVPASAPASAPTVPPAAVAEPVPAAASEPLAVADAASAPVPAASATAASEEPGPEWPPSTQLSYNLQGNYRGEVQGQAQVQWIRQGRHYQVHLDVSVGPSFAPLISRRMSSDGMLTAQGIVPQRYDEETRVVFRGPRRGHIAFEGPVLRLADGQPQEQPVGVQDAASQFVHLTWLFLTGRETLRVGQVVEMPLALPRRLYRWRYEVLGEELLQTPMGPLATWHLRPQSDSQHRASRDLKAEVWLAPGLQYLPVRLRIEQDEQSYLDLTLKAPPLQAAP